MTDLVTNAPTIRRVEQLIGLSRCDWKYADLYLLHARELMTSALDRPGFEAVSSRERTLAELLQTLRAAILRSDWAAVEEIGTEARNLRTSLQSDAVLLSVGRAVYGKWSLPPTRTALLLGGAIPQAAETVRHELARLRKDLLDLGLDANSGAALYLSRAAELAQLQVETAVGSAPTIDRDALRDAALAAAEELDFDDLLRVVHDASRGGVDRMGRVRAPLPTLHVAASLAEAISDDALEKAEKLGLQAVELQPNEPLNAYLSCRCGARPILPRAPLGEHRFDAETCTCGHACPPGVGGELRKNLDALMMHPFMTTGGTRYLPWFGRERLLVESFGEEAVDETSPLLDRLKLSSRRGISRSTLESALLEKGPEVCESIGIDPMHHRLVCIPFDAYHRLGKKLGWGAREMWTHFDGYQVTRELRLRALVGGDRRYGGPDDLCSVGVDYESPKVVARLALVRRSRFDVRSGSRASD